MAKNYFYSTILLLLFSLGLQAQESKDAVFGSKLQEQPFENLSIYPNPVTSGKLYINSKTTAAKEIEIFDILGKKVFQATITTKELNITALTTGVYIIKIKEGEYRATRKLVIK
ncbi:T9SS type A sorting domain-containing protein [Flavobacterium sp.]|uniref:T9SS type A sorting domain-containing protein n=1 Tax=Flavobacterium sp. TaxID=239 RepID=UPI00286DB505|nr:T9SS type A sorting domain-containing protein [Flavobacterium sp.]